MQTRLISAFEATTNTVVGYWVSVTVGQLLIYPMHGYEITLTDNISMTAMFVGISLVKSYLCRRAYVRWLNEWFRKLIAKWTAH